MDLAARRSSHLKEKFVMRLGCFLVSFAVLASLVFYSPKAKAFTMTSSAVTALAGGFLSACGLTPVVSGMGSSSEVNESVARLIQEYLDTKVGGQTVLEWIGDVALVAKDGKVMIPRLVAEKLGQFAGWVAGKYGTKSGTNEIYGPIGSYLLLLDGSQFLLSVLDSSYKVTSVGTIISSSNVPMVFSTGASITFSISESKPSEWVLRLFKPGGIKYISGAGFREPHTFCLAVCADGTFRFCWKKPTDLDWDMNQSQVLSFQDWMQSDVLSSDGSLSLDVAETLTIPGELTDGQSIALDVGATGAMSIQDILQGILDAILAGELSASAEIVDEAEQPVDPDPPPVVPVVPEGLDELGAALTSRFPFSIPWDVYKGVTLLAAPPKAPYFEVDLLAPIAHRVGGWQGSTTIVLDFSEYEIIGQVCRWTSTIGFCLMLAAGTKRLIWTA